MINKLLRFIVSIHCDNGSMPSDLTSTIDGKTCCTHPYWLELKRYYSGRHLPNIGFVIRHCPISIPKIDNNTIRIVVIDKEDITETISVDANPSHIILLYTESTDISKIDLASFSYCKLVKSKQEVEEVLVNVYFDSFQYYVNELYKEFNGNENSIFNKLKLEYIKTHFKCSHSETQKYDSLYAYAQGENVKQRVQNGCEIWLDFVNWLKNNKDTYKNQKSNFDKHINDKSNSNLDDEEINRIVNDIYKNKKFAGQIGRASLIKEVRRNYSYPCYLVRIKRKPKKIAQRKKLVALMSKKEFKCGIFKIVTQRNIFKYYVFESYIDIYKLQ